MQAVAFLSFLLPLVASLPPALNGRSETSRPAERKMITSLAQFSFKNWTMSEVCLDCTRDTTDVMYECTFTCKFFSRFPPFLPLFLSLVSLPAGEASAQPVVLTTPRRHLVHWDDPNFNTSSYCKNHWQWDGVTTKPGPGNTYNTDYSVCEVDLPELWQFKFFEMDDAGGFNMSLTHRCVDDMYVASPILLPFLLLPIPSPWEHERRSVANRANLCPRTAISSPTPRWPNSSPRPTSCWAWPARMTSALPTRLAIPSLSRSRASRSDGCGGGGQRRGDRAWETWEYGCTCSCCWPGGVAFSRSWFRDLGQG